MEAQRVARRDAQHRGPAIHELVAHPPARTAGPEAEAVRADQRRRLLGLLAEVLTDKQRAVMVLRVWCDLSVEETAAQLGLSAGAVRVTQHRALAKLRARVGGAR